jgi:hypothetical protein
MLTYTVGLLAALSRTVPFFLAAAPDPDAAASATVQDILFWLGGGLALIAIPTGLFLAALQLWQRRTSPAEPKDAINRQ